VPTEILDMTLTGTSSFGPVTVSASPDQQSTGEVCQQEVGQDFPATSFFDVYVMVDLPDLDMTLHNEEAMHMEATLSSLPPAEGDEYRGEDDRPLYTPAGLQVGRIVDALHIPEPGEDGDGEEAAPTPTEEEAAPTPTEPTGGGATSEGYCEHGTTTSVLLIKFTGLEPGQTVSGTATGPAIIDPPDGSGPDFEVTADANGEATAEIDIAQVGEYAWTTADGMTGTFTVGQTCPPEP
jgi:hypothetical protein